MEEEEIRNILSKSVNLVKGMEERYQIPAFKTILEFFLLTSMKSSDETKSMPLTSIHADSSTLSLTEFILQSKTTTYNDQVLATIYYLFMDGTATFTVSMIKDEFMKARLKKPANMADVIYKLLKKGFIQEYGKLDGKTAYQITLTGQQRIEELLKD